MTESEALTDIQKRAILNDFSLKIARFSYSPHDLLHKSPLSFLRHLKGELGMFYNRIRQRFFKFNAYMVASFTNIRLYRILS